MKRFFAMVLSLALILGLMPATVLAADVPTKCQHCGTTPTWEVMPTNWKAKPAGHYHYYLDKDVTPGQLLAGTDIKMDVCLDLNGHSINTDGRAMIAWYGSTINIMDSSANQTGYICGSTGSNNSASGSLAATKNGTLRLYSGTLKFKRDNTGLGVGKGGVMCAESTGTIEILGGRVEGAEMVVSSATLTNNGSGGAIYVYNGGKLTVSGGEITSGTVPASAQGPCVFLEGNNAKMTLTGNGKVAEICNNGNSTNLTIAGTYTGKARLKLATGKTAANGTTVAVATGADISGADLFCTNGDGYTVEKSGDNLVLKAFTPTADRHLCAHCNDIVRWKPVKDNTALFKTAGQHHLYFSENYAGKQLNAQLGAKVCLDLNGKQILTDGRALHIGANSQLNVMDSVGGGQVIGTTGGNNPTGGTLAVGGSGGICNIYGGTFSLQTDDTGPGVGTGGVLYMSTSGTINMYGGKILGADLVISGYELTINGYGAAAYIGSTGQLNVYGGEITSGTVPNGGLGKCVYLATGTAKMTLSGNAKVDEIYAQKNSQPLNITGTYTGAANLRFPEEQAILENMQVGTCTNADLSKATLACVNGKGYFLANDEGKLVISSFGLDAVAAAINSDEAKGYNTLQEAIDACTDGYVRLLKDAEGTATVTRDLYIDMNGQNAAITAAEGVTIYGFDSQTNDYTVSDGKYGKLTVTGGQATGLPETSDFAEDNYLMVNENGSISFHRVTLQVYAMSLRGDEAGIYYKSHFLADEKAAAQLSSHGIALSVLDIPNAQNMDSDCAYSTHQGFESGPVGNLGNNSSTLLKGILKDTYSDFKNRSNLNMTIYGRAYAKTADGQLLFGAPVSRSFKEQLEAVDTILPGLSQQQVDAAAGLYKKFEKALSGLNLPNMAAAAQKEEKGALKVLSLGHSHGLDGTALLYEVLDAELDQDIVVGALYYSGCSMASHAKYLTGNMPEYDYYKKDKTNVNGAWTITKETTCLYALQDEQWDVIVIQDANFNAGMESVYNKDVYMTVLNYLYNNQEDQPRILFHMTWTNPDDYENYISAGSSLSHPNLTSWYIPTMEGRYGDENGVYQREILIDKILSYTEKYLEDCTDFLGEKYIESVIPAATAVEYAQYVCGRPDAEIYRDWTHMNDYGRLIVAYTWYAKIMQLDKIDSVKVTEVPKGAHHSNSKFPADLKFDEQMRYDALNAVNFALQNPYADIANGEVTPEAPLPLDPATPALPALLQVDNKALSLNDANQATCPVCDQQVTWIAITDTASQQVLEGGKHYYLTGDLTSGVTTEGYIVASSSTPACLHLNGHNITATATSAIFASGKLNVMGEGTVSGTGMTFISGTNDWSKHRGAAVDLNAANAVVNLYGGNYTKPADNTKDVVAVFSNGGTVNLFDGVTINISSHANGRCVKSFYGAANIYGGTYVGTAKAATIHANNWSTSKSGTVRVFGGNISGAYQSVGGSGQATARGTVEIYGGTIGKVQLSVHTNAIIGGNPIINHLYVPAGGILTLGRLTEGASIKVNATGVFTNPSLNAAAYLEKGYFSTVNAEKAISVVDNALSCN